MKLFRTIRGRLFICYTSIIILIVAAFSVLYYNYTANILEKRASESLQQLSINNNSNLDSMIKNMDATANRIISSALIKKTFYAKPASEGEAIAKRQRMMELLFTATGSKIDNQINLIGTDGTFVEYGRVFDISLQSADALAAAPWSALHLKGKCIFQPRTSTTGTPPATELCRCAVRSTRPLADAITDLSRF
ncbi:MAG: hypothetical protein RSD27_10830 [Ruthenibacterium sp.]